MPKYTDKEFADKVEWEGGLFEAIFEYGLKSEHLVNQDGDIAIFLKELETVWEKEGITNIINALEGALESANYYDEDDDDE